MKYTEYLLSNHWIQFRSKILEDRKLCQNCGVKERLNIHHKHYKSLGREKGTDVIVLCQKCHHRFHSKKIWQRKMKKGEELDFTGRIPNKKYHSDFYETCKVMRKCNRCAEMHGIFYMLFRDGSISMAMVCKNSRPSTKFLKLEKGLDIPTFESRKIRKEREKISTETL